MSALSAFCNQLVRFFEELVETLPEEREIRLSLDTIQGAKKINPRLILDMFNEHVVKDLRDPIMNENVEQVITYARAKIQGQFNEVLPAITIFDTHWSTLSDVNQKAIWKYLKVLVLLADKAKTSA
jgi:hypothetical protein